MGRTNEEETRRHCDTTQRSTRTTEGAAVKNCWLTSESLTLDHRASDVRASGRPSGVAPARRADLVVGVADTCDGLADTLPRPPAEVARQWSAEFQGVGTVGLSPDERMDAVRCGEWKIDHHRREQQAGGNATPKWRCHAATPQPIAHSQRLGHALNVWVMLHSLRHDPLCVSCSEIGDELVRCNGGVLNSMSALLQ